MLVPLAPPGAGLGADFVGRPVREPTPFDPRAVVDFVRARGSVAFPSASLPPDFLDWRRNLRRAAKQIDMRISVLQRADVVWVLNPDYEPSDAEMAAIMDVVGSLVEPETVDFETALHRQHRNRLRVVPEED